MPDARKILLTHLKCEINALGLIIKENTEQIDMNMSMIKWDTHHGQEEDCCSFEEVNKENERLIEEISYYLNALKDILTEYQSLRDSDYADEMESDLYVELAALRILPVKLAIPFLKSAEDLQTLQSRLEEKEEYELCAQLRDHLQKSVSVQKFR